MTNEGPQRSDPSPVLLVILLALGVLLRLVFLDSDPVYPLWAGYITDEGRWTEVGREWVLFGSPDFDSWFSKIHLALAPLYQATTALSFAMFGTNLGSARLVSAIFGIGLVLGVFLFLRRCLSTEALFFSVLVLAVQPDLLFLSRVAIPETAAMLFEFLAFALVVSQPRSTKRAFGAGLLTAVALGMKATAAPIVPILAVTVVLLHRVDDPSSRPRRLRAYVAGVAAPAVLIFGAGLALGFGSDLQLTAAFEPLADLMRLNSAFGVFSLLMYENFAPALNALLLPVWAIVGLLIAVGRPPSHPARAVYLGSAIWIVGWVLASAVMEYYPERYVFHVLVPLAVNLGAGVTLLQTVGGQKILDSLGAVRGVRRAVVTAWLSLPLAVLFSPILLAVARGTGLDVERLRSHLVAVVLLEVVLAAVFCARSPRRHIAFMVVAVPLIFGLFWFFGVELGVFPDGFWALGTPDILAKAVLLSVSAAVAAVIYSGRDRRGVLRRWSHAYLALVAAPWIIQIAPKFMTPTYTMVDASSALGDLVDESTLVGTARAASIFLGTRLRYTEEVDVDPLPDVIVTALGPLAPGLLETYRLVEVHDLNLGAAYMARREGGDSRVWIYRRLR